MSKLIPVKMDRDGNPVPFIIRKTGGASIGVSLNGFALNRSGLSLGDKVYEYVDEKGRIVLIPESEHVTAST